MQESIKRISRMKGLSLVFVTIVVALLMRAGVAEAASWSVIPSPNGPSGDGLFYGIASVSSNDVWAVGEDFPGINQQTLTEHWDGSKWNVISSPNENSTDVLSAVATVSTNDVWAVGYTYSIQTLIEHWNGTQWSIVPSPSPGTKDNRLTGVTAISTNDVWAVGYEAGGNSATQTLTEHWDGTQWSVVSSPNHQGSLGSILTAVTSVSTNDVWAVGSYDSCFSCSESLVEHWDGTQWSILSSPNHGLCDKLNGVTAISTNDVWAVGNAARKCNFQNNLKGTALIENWNGKKWSIASSPKATGVVVLYGVSAASQNDIWAVGVTEFKHIFSTITEHWNGTQWSVVPSPNPGIQQNILFSVAASGSDFWAVGDYFIPQGNTDHPLTELYA